MGWKTKKKELRVAIEVTMCRNFRMTQSEGRRLLVKD